MYIVRNVIIINCFIFSVTITVTVNLHFSVIIKVAVNLQLFSSYFAILV